MITLDVDVTKAVSWFDDAEEKQLPFAISKALNDTAKDFQADERVHMHDIFHVNRDQWVNRNVKITHFAKKAGLWAEIAIAPPGEKSDILGKFEDETEKTPSQGHALAIPVDAKRTGAGVLSNSIRPRNLNLQQVSSRNGLTIYRGDNNTLMLQRADGTGLILQRNARHEPGARDGTVLFILTPHAKLLPNLQFEVIGEHTVDERFAERFDAAWDLAMETAR
jgi:hypothetical protein